MCGHFNFLILFHFYLSDRGGINHQLTVSWMLWIVYPGMYQVTSLCFTLCKMQVCLFALHIARAVKVHI